MIDSYVAGFFDGEGTALIGKQTKNGKVYQHFSVMLSQSGEDGHSLLQRIQKEHGGKLYQHLKVGQHKATKNAYKLYWNRDEGITFLKRMLPYLILKHETAKKTLEYMERNIAEK